MLQGKGTTARSTLTVRSELQPTSSKELSAAADHVLAASDSVTSAGLPARASIVTALRRKDERVVCARHVGSSRPTFFSTPRYGSHYRALQMGRVRRCGDIFVTENVQQCRTWYDVVRACSRLQLRVVP